jgi:hypothetical protein
MKPSLIRRQRHPHRQQPHREKERGATMALVAVAMVAIIAMAALSIDAITLYLANAEAQRSADSAALAAARVISLSGITGTANPTTQSTYWQQICGVVGTATETAQALATQNTVGGVGANVTVRYSAGPGGAGAADCSTLAAGFAIDPLVTVKVQRTNLPTFFARIWGNSGSSVSATAVAEGFNPSNSASLVAGGIVPVQPRCVKPWVVPNFDPLNPQPGAPHYCGEAGQPACNPIVDLTTGSIQNPGISTGSGGNGVIGETFWLVLDCNHNNPASCTIRGGNTQPKANYVSGASSVKPPPNLLYAPG